MSPIQIVVRAISAASQVDLDAVEDFRASAGGQRLEPQFLAFIVDAEFEILDTLECHVEKIARAAGRVENAQRREPFDKTPALVFRLGPLHRP